MEPGSNYSILWGACFTLCDVCHDAIEGKGNWGWTQKRHQFDAKQLASRVRRSSYRDLEEEENWRKQEAWGAWVKRLRSARVSALFPLPKSGMAVRRRKKISPIVRFQMHSGIAWKDLLDFEAGRREPLLFEAKKLAVALNITLDDLAIEKKVDEGWRVLCEQRSKLRALVFRALEPEESEIGALGRAAQYIWELLAQADE
jgi:hypothetical protein